MCPGFKRKPQIDCPYGLVINPSTGGGCCLVARTSAAGTSGKPMTRTKHAEATVPDDIRQAGVRVATRYKATPDCICTVGGTSNVSGVPVRPVGFTLPAGFQPLPQTVRN